MPIQAKNLKREDSSILSPINEKVRISKLSNSIVLPTRTNTFHRIDEV